MPSRLETAGGESYDQLMGRWSRLLAVPLLDFMGTLDGDNLLDVGCGTGSLPSILARRDPSIEIVGLDFSPEYVEYAKKYAGGDHITYQVGDVTSLEFQDDYFANTAAMLVLHFVSDPDKAISEMKRVTRSGGKISAAVWDQRSLVFNRVFFDTAAAIDTGADERRKAMYVLPMTGPGQLADAWRRAGLSDVRDTALTIHMHFASFEDYIESFIGDTGPAAAYVNSLDHAKKEALIEAVRSAYLDGDSDGVRAFAATAWAVCGLVP
jgi:ubiquinone/menaquinone biosynthesis C-methylase UbiE